MSKQWRLRLIFILIVITTGYLLKPQITAIIYQQITKDMFVSSDNDNFDPGIKIGNDIPPISALYQGEVINDLTPFSGTKGTVLVVSRSLDWCPYCMRQMTALQDKYAQFKQENIGLVAITYDAPAAQQAFIDKHQINIPVLSDINAASFIALGILNTDYHQGDDNYGLAYPGILVIDSQGKVVGKQFIEAFSSRVSAKSVLNYAKQVLVNNE